MTAQLIVAGPSYCGLIAAKLLIVLGYCGYCDIAGGPPDPLFSRARNSNFPFTYKNYNKYNNYFKKRLFSGRTGLIAELIARNKRIERRTLRPPYGHKLRIEGQKSGHFCAGEETMPNPTYKLSSGSAMALTATRTALSPLATRVGNSTTAQPKL